MHNRQHELRKTPTSATSIHGIGRYLSMLECMGSGEGPVSFFLGSFMVQRKSPHR